jgi:hypothetical protein
MLVAASGTSQAADAHTFCCHCSVKKAVLRLVEVFVEKCEDDVLLVTKFVPALMEPVLGDYAASVPDARWADRGGGTSGVFAACMLSVEGYVGAACRWEAGGKRGVTSGLLGGGQQYL